MNRAAVLQPTACKPLGEEAEDVRRLMDGKLAAMVLTAPHNVDYVGKTVDELKIQNDKISDADLYKFLLQSYTNMIEAVAPGGANYVCHADSERLNFCNAKKDTSFEARLPMPFSREPTA